MQHRNVMETRLCGLCRDFRRAFDCFVEKQFGSEARQHQKSKQRRQSTNEKEIKRKEFVARQKTNRLKCPLSGRSFGVTVSIENGNSSVCQSCQAEDEAKSETRQ